MSSHNMYAYCENNPISRVDPQGKFWMIAAGIIGGVVNSAAQITSNVINGNAWYDAIGGAFAGGFTTGFLLTTTLNPIIAFGAGSLVESTFDETYDYVTKKKEFNAKNTAKSVMDIEWNTIGGGALGKLTGEVAGKMVKINPGWIKPEKFTTAFFGKTAQKTLLQNGAQSALTLPVNVAKNKIGNPTNKPPQKPTATSGSRWKWFIWKSAEGGGGFR